MAVYHPVAPGRWEPFGLHVVDMHPAVTDQGRRLFDESVPLTRLTLLEGTRPAPATPC